MARDHAESNFLRSPFKGGVNKVVFNCLAPYLSLTPPLYCNHSPILIQRSISEGRRQDNYVPPKFSWAGKRTTDWRRGPLTLNQLPGSSILCTVSEPFTYVIRLK